MFNLLSFTIFAATAFMAMACITSVTLAIDKSHSAQPLSMNSASDCKKLRRTGKIHPTLGDVLWF